MTIGRLLGPVMSSAVTMSATAIVIAALAVTSIEARAQGSSQARFAAWVESLWPDARRLGVSRKLFTAAFKGVAPDEAVEKSNAHQPEFVRPLWEYLERAVSAKRIRSGRILLNKFDTRLRLIERRIGVDRHILVAIWGMESNYGGNKGSHNVIQALATLAYRGERRSYGRTQLLAALQILQRGDIPIGEMKGSWAGAMGHTQFIPTTYNRYAVDFTRDGKRDIWGSMSDALASTASYLKASGWQTREPWGHEVQLPQGFDFAETGLAKKKLTAEWVGLGVKRANGAKFSEWAREASIIVPTGANGPAFMVFDNFRAIMRYNNSVAYALAVSQLSERFRSRGLVKRPWPVSDRPLSTSQKKELQVLLASKGFKIGKIDGRLGPKTTAALRRFQQRAGLVPDGYASLKVLRRLRRGG